MKNIISAAIIATVATVGSMASADITTKGLVFRDGQEIGTMYDVKIMDGKTDAEARAEIEAHYAKVKADSKRERDQEVKAKNLEAGKTAVAIKVVLFAADMVDVADTEEEVQVIADVLAAELETISKITSEDGLKAYNERLEAAIAEANNSDA